MQVFANKYLLDYLKRRVEMSPYQYINTFARFGRNKGYNPGLERINALLAAYGHPENKIKTIHVAGTNGKGSTITYLKNIYQEAGYKVGVYTSPHLIDFNERIEVNGQKSAQKNWKNW